MRLSQSAWAACWAIRACLFALGWSDHDHDLVLALVRVCLCVCVWVCVCGSVCVWVLRPLTFTCFLEVTTIPQACSKSAVLVAAVAGGGPADCGVVSVVFLESSVPQCIGGGCGVVSPAAAAAAAAAAAGVAHSGGSACVSACSCDGVGRCCGFG